MILGEDRGHVMPPPSPKPPPNPRISRPGKAGSMARLPRPLLFQIFLMSATPQKNIDIGFNQEKETVISGNPSLKDIVISFVKYHLSLF